MTTSIGRVYMMLPDHSPISDTINSIYLFLDRNIRTFSSVYLPDQNISGWIKKEKFVKIYIPFYNGVFVFLYAIFCCFSANRIITLNRYLVWDSRRHWDPVCYYQCICYSGDFRLHSSAGVCLQVWTLCRSRTSWRKVQ